ncbi:uncharacterized protein LOC118196681 [Stegodyphus dumicola]|uniref:uncharacterized protein LOC118196681 n=1 Tax=Stegodyphus dumicola TaxID=202533 RepID=UPI0015B121FF|nr:uncharacterized protein LOC118196681 [Stegodyphus dumicola]
MNPSSFIASSLNSSEDLASQLISIINLTANIVKSIHASEKTEYYQDLLSLSLPQNQLSGNYKLSKSNDKKDLGSLKLKDKPALLTENKNILLNKLLRSNNTDEKSEKINIEKSVCCENKTCEVSPVIMNDTKSSFHSHSEIVPNVQNMNLELLNKNKTSYNSESFNLPSKAMLYSNQLIKDSRSHFENSLPNRPVGIAADCEDSDSDSIVFICESSNSFNNKLPDNNMNAQNENNIQSEEFNRAKRFKYTEQTDKSVIDPHKITEHFRSNVNQNVIPEDVLNSISCFNVHAKNSIDKLPTLSEVLSYNHSATKYSDTGDKHSYSETFNLPNKDMVYSNQLVNNSTTSLPNVPVHIKADCEDSKSDSFSFACKSSNSCSNKLPDKSMKAQYGNNIQAEEDNRVKCLKCSEQTNKSVINVHKIARNFRSKINGNVVPEANLNSSTCFNVHAKNSTDKLPTLSEVLSYNNNLATKYCDTGDKFSYSETFNLPSKDMVYSNQLVYNSTSHFRTSLPNVPVHIKADCEDSNSDSFSFVYKSSNSCSNKLSDKSMNAQYENNIQAEEDNRVKCLKCSEQTDKSVINVHKIAENFRSNINGNVSEANLNSSTCFNVHAKNSTDKLPTLSEVLSYNNLATKYCDTGDKFSYSETFNLPSKDMVYSNQLVYNSTSHFRTSLPNVPVHIKADCEDSNSDSFSFVYKSSNSCSNKLPDKSMNAQYENNIQAEEDNRVKCLKCSELTDKSVMNVHKIAENFRSKINGNAVPEANLNSSTCFNVHAKNSIDKLPTLSELLSYNHLATKYADIEDALLCSEYFNLPSKGMLYSNQLINDSTSHFENSLPNVPVCIEGDCEESDSDSVIFVYESNNKLPDKNVNVQYENNIQSQDDNRVKCFKSEKQIDKSVIDAHKIAEHFPSNINQNITPEAIHNCFNIHDNNSIDKLPAFSEVSSYNPLAIKYSDTGHNYSCSEASVLQENCERVSAADIGFIHSELDTIKPCEVNCSSDERILNKNIEPTEITAVELRKIIDIAQNLFFEKKSLDIQSTSNYSYAGTEYVDRMSSSSVELPYKDCNSKFPDTDDKIFHSEMSVNRQNNITEGQSVISDVTDIIQTSYIENHIGLQNKIPFSCPDNGTVYTRMGMIQRREDGENSKKCL